MDTKICGKCKQEKPVNEFYKSERDGYRSRCKDCHREDLREYAKTGYYARYHREYNQKPRVRIKNMARWYTNHEIRAGRINREPCAVCGKEQGDAHHLDYNQPLIIVWLCADCHREAHKQLKGGE